MKNLPNPLTSWDEVNLALRTLGDLTMRKRELENSLTEKKNAIQAEHDLVAKPVLDELTAVHKTIEAFVLEHKDEFVDSRTKEFSHGTISCRVSKSVRVLSKEVCLKALKAAKMMDFIKIKEDPNKDMLKTLTDVQLAKVGCSLTVKDNISIEPFLEELESQGAPL